MQSTMNIYAKRGHKVKYCYPNNGYDYDRELCNKHLTQNSVYTVEFFEVESFSSRIYLQEVPEIAFNTVMFCDYTEPEFKTGVELIAAERKRQIEVEGWTEKHDKENNRDELAIAAACYALPRHLRDLDIRELILDKTTKQLTVVAKGLCRIYNWPWDEKWWKPTPDNRIKELTKAGALIAAEIDRLQNTKSKED